MSNNYIFREVNVTLPTEEVSKKGWVKWGRLNLFPQYLLSLYYNSPIHGGVINSKVKFIASAGLSYRGSGVEWATIKNNGKSKYTLDELVEMLSFDQEIADCYYIKANKDLATGKWSLNPLSFELIRPNEDKTIFYYSEDWSTDKQDQERTGFKEYKSFFSIDKEIDTECVLAVQSLPKQFLIDGKKLSKGFFSVPPYASGIDSIETDIEINFFRRSEVVNGYKGGSILSLNNGIPESEEVQNKIIKDIKGDATDRNKQGGMAIVFSEGSENAPTITQLNGNDLDKRYESTEKGLMQKIMISHSVINPKLFGVISTDSFSDGELISDFMLFKETYGKFRQKTILEGLNYLLSELNGITGKIEFKDFDLTLEKQIEDESSLADSLNKMSPLLATKVLERLTDNEIRSLGNLPPVEGGDVIKSQAPQFSSVDSGKSTEEGYILDLFSKCGTPKDTVKIVHTQVFEGQTDEDCIKKFNNLRFAVLSDLHLNIITLANAGESYGAIAEAVKLTSKELSAELQKLQKNGYLEGLEPTAKALVELANKETIKVVYSYDEKVGAPALVPGGKSRPFCQTLLDANKVFTRDEINQIGSQVGRDVWTYKGGWYHNPKTDNNTPSCRHTWNQNIIVG